MVIYIRDKELDQERPKEDNNWIIGFLTILIIGFIGSSIVAYRSYMDTGTIKKKRAFI
jgi:capsular polysaccharide biosynthesis protein